MALALPLLLLTMPVSAAEPTAPDGGSALLLDEIVAFIEDQAILWSDLFLEARMMALEKNGPAAFLSNPEPRQLKMALDRLIDQRVVQQEANRLQVFPVAPAELDQALREMRSAIGPKAFDQFLNEKQVDEATIREILDRELRAKRYLEGRFKLPARPSEADIESWFAGHEKEYAGKTLEESKPAIRDRLTRENLARLSTDFTADVRRRARVRVLHDPATPAGEMRMSGSAAAPRSATEPGEG